MKLTKEQRNAHDVDWNHQVIECPYVEDAEKLEMACDDAAMQLMKAQELQGLLTEITGKHNDLFRIIERLKKEKEWDSKEVYKLIRIVERLKEYEAQLMHSEKYQGVRKRLQKILGE